MNKGNWKHTDNTDVISMEEYLYRRKRIREQEQETRKKGSDTVKLKGLTPFETYLVSSSSWS